MARTPRSHLPGAVFHLTARIQGHEPLFREHIRSRIAEYVASSIEVSDARLLAWAIMPNHFHIVLLQGDWRLERIMQPMMTRIAKLVQRANSVEGHVFEGRFKDTPCLDPDHARNAIVYTHLNPARGDLVADPGQYPWSSQAMYLDRDAGPHCMAGVCQSEIGLRLFADRESLTVGELRERYLAFVSWRQEQDRRIDQDENGAAPESRPRLLGGAIPWSVAFAPMFRPRSAHPKQDDGVRARDLTEIATRVLAEVAPDVPLQLLRSGSRARPVVRARRAAVRRMNEAHYRGCAIARYLRISPQCVSKVLRNGGGDTG